MKYEYLKIKALLLDGRIASYNFDFMLDGFLYNAFAREYHPELIGRPCDSRKLIDFELPLEKVANKGDWYYLCSKGFFEQINEDSIDFFHKTLNLKEAETYIEGNKKGIDHGYFRAYRNPMVIKTSKEIIWYCKGEKKEIIKLLKKHVQSIGGKHSIGYGTIEKWDVFECDKIIFDDKMRPIPNLNGNALKRIRPPYHNQLNERRCSYNPICFSTLQKI